ncbi:MAG: HAD hydrolase-like protein, partial [Bacteroidota bacterium]
MLRNIIWDVDGTLFDTYPPIAKAFQEALDELGIKASRRSKAWPGSP